MSLLCMENCSIAVRESIAYNEKLRPSFLTTRKGNRAIARAVPKGRMRGKSELRRAGCWVTPSGSDPKESATEMQTADGPPREVPGAGSGKDATVR